MSQCKAGCHVILEDQEIQLDNELCNACVMAVEDVLNDPLTAERHPLTGEKFDDEE